MPIRIQNQHIFIFSKLIWSLKEICLPLSARTFQPSLAFASKTQNQEVAKHLVKLMWNGASFPSWRTWWGWQQDSNPRIATPMGWSHRILCCNCLYILGRCRWTLPHISFIYPRVLVIRPRCLSRLAMSWTSRAYTRSMRWWTRGSTMRHVYILILSSFKRSRTWAQRNMYVIRPCRSIRPIWWKWRCGAQLHRRHQDQGKQPQARRAQREARLVSARSRTRRDASQTWEAPSATKMFKYWALAKRTITVARIRIITHIIQTRSRSTTTLKEVDVPGPQVKGSWINLQWNSTRKFTGHIGSKTSRTATQIRRWTSLGIRLHHLSVSFLQVTQFRYRRCRLQDRISFGISQHSHRAPISECILGSCSQIPSSAS